MCCISVGDLRASICILTFQFCHANDIMIARTACSSLRGRYGGDKNLSVPHHPRLFFISLGNLLNQIAFTAVLISKRNASKYL